MQYSLLYSSSIVQHFSFYRMKLFQLEKSCAFLKFFSQKQNKMATILRSSRSHLPNLFLSLIPLILDVP